MSQNQTKDLNVIRLYEIQRQAYLIAFKQSPDDFSQARAYAYQHRVAPIFDQAALLELHQGDPFEDAYAASSDFANRVTRRVDELWRGEKWAELAFSRLEDEFGGYKAQRMELAAVLGYARLHGLYDDAVWSAIGHYAPIEATLPTSFSKDDVFI